MAPTSTLLLITYVAAAISTTNTAVASPGVSEIRTLWSLRGGVKNFSKKTNPRSVAVGVGQDSGNVVYDDENKATTPITTEVPVPTSLVMTGGPGRRRRRQLDLGEALNVKKSLSRFKSTHKVAFTQVGYLQFIRYQIPVPDLPEWTMCSWVWPKNLTYDCPIFSYSRNERERLIRIVLKSPEKLHQVPHLQLFLLEQKIYDLELPEAAERRWFHICSSWDSILARWHVYVDGKIVSWGKYPQVRGLHIPAGGDIVLGQEYTDFNKGLDDGLEGEMYGFYLFLSESPSISPSKTFDLFSGWDSLLANPRRRLRQPERTTFTQLVRSTKFGDGIVPKRVASLYKRCVEPMRSYDDLLISWSKTPIRVFGGAIISKIRPQCGAF